eukprot:145965-Chlamydomonas_euryale.AAC.7
MACLFIYDGTVESDAGDFPRRSSRTQDSARERMGKRGGTATDWTTTRSMLYSRANFLGASVCTSGQVMRAACRTGLPQKCSCCRSPIGTR